MIPSITFSRYCDEDTLAGVLRDLTGWSLHVTTITGDLIGEVIHTSEDKDGNATVRLALLGDPDNCETIRVIDIAGIIVT